MATYQKSVIMIATWSCLAMVSCTNPNSAQQAGEKIDRAVEQAGDHIDDAKQTIATDSEQAKVDIADSVITTKIKTAFLAESSIASANITVTTVNGVVTLTGIVNSQAASDKATDIVNVITEVKQLKNQLNVQSAQ